jgi:pimeloyl-ACP methyl ester carboxylesterase
MKFCKNACSRRTVFLAFGILLALGVFKSGKAADVPGQPAAAQTNRFAATIVPAEHFEIDGVLIERHGAAAGRPLILIPGLASGSWVWQDTIRAFGAEHPLYVLTLPGFDGRPPAGPNPFALARAAVAKLIESRNLARPVIVGHSLGGILGFALAEDKPALLGGLVSIDGLPVMPGSEDFAPAQRAQFAENMRARVANATPDAFAGQQQAYMRTIGVLDMGKADDLAKLSGRSDPKSVGQYVADVLNLDLRPGLKTIQAPVLLLAPYFDLDASQRGLQESTVADYYRALTEGTPRLQVTTVSPARHFAMIDEPQKVEDAIRAFLKTLQ